MPEMKIDIQRIFAEGHTYIMSVLDEQKEEEWKSVVATRLPGNTPEELDIMKTLWSHGYASGAKSAISFIMALKNKPTQ